MNNQNAPKRRKAKPPAPHLKLRANKYGNSTCRCNQGHIHRSRFEAVVCNDLHLEYHKELKKGSVEIQTEQKFSLDVEGIHIANHFMDFLITFEGGKEKAVEAKGFETAVWKMKKNLFKALYPDIEYEVRYYNKKIRSRK